MGETKAVEVKVGDIQIPQVPAGLTFLSDQMFKALSMVPQLNVEEAIRRTCTEMDSAPKEVDDYAYSIPYGGKQEEGLSINGALLLRDKLAELGFIIELDPNYRKEEDDEQITVTAVARRVFPCAVAPNLRTGSMEQFNIIIADSLGYKRVNKQELRSDESGYYDVRFALEKVVSLAYRNAILNLLPDKLVAEVQRHACNTGRVKKGEVSTRKAGGWTQKKNGADTRPVTEPQLNRLMAIMKSTDYSEDVVKQYIKTTWNLDSRKDLNRDQYDHLCAKLEAGEIAKAEKLL